MAESYGKVKSVAKNVTVKGPDLDSKVLSTMKRTADIVGATLGPGGNPVLVERQEYGLPSYVTKDGVTVFQSLGFLDPTEHAIMETARDASVRTNSEAGDGTTTATVLSEAIVRLMNEYTKKHPRVSPQFVVRELERCFREDIDPTIKSLSCTASRDNEEGIGFLRSVARISTNGDSPLADAVIDCFEISGDQGNVTITETSGPSSYEVEHVDGYSIGTGYEESCGKWYGKFINDPATQRCVLEKPVVVLYHGQINDIGTVRLLMEAVGDAWQTSRGGEEGEFNGNVILMATGFSDVVLGIFATNFNIPSMLSVFPLVVPKSPMLGGQYELLADISALTGARIFDPINDHPDSLPYLEAQRQGQLKDLLHEYLGPGIDRFEAGRYRSNVLGMANEDDVLVRIDELQAQIENAASRLDKMLLEERMAKLSGGIAKLVVRGPSNGELKEKRDRAEDAVCAVRGAISDGFLPGGGWTLLYLAEMLDKRGSDILSEVLVPALRSPVERLYSNAGLITEEDREEVLKPILTAIRNNAKKHKYLVYDVLEGKHVDAYESGLLDSTPAVLEAIRNSLSIASLLGCLGGTIVYARDLELERQEALDNSEWLRNAGVNPANERP